MNRSARVARPVLVLIGLLIPLCCGTALAAEPAAGTGRPRVGLVLGGGGARGAAHIGVLEVLEELQVPVDCVAGTSMGALVAGVYTAGMSPAQMREELGKADWVSMFQDNPEYDELNPRNKEISRRFLPGTETGVTERGVQYQSGMVSGQKIKLFFNYLVHANLGEREIQELPTPLSLIATDVGSGERVVMREGSLTKAMRASMSVPGMMAPEDHLGRKLVDGGLVDNVPIGEVRERCQADVVIAVNVGSPLLPPDEVNSLLSVTAQMVNILTEQNVQRSLATLKPSDILIAPDLTGITASDFERNGETADRGRAAALAVAERLRPLATSPEAYAAWRQKSTATAAQAAPRIDAVEITGLQVVNPAAVERHLAVAKDGAVKTAELERDLLRVYGDGFYEKVDYTLLTSRERNILRITPVEKSWGPDYMRFGFNLETESKNGSSYTVRGAYHKTWLNALGGEVLLSGEFGSRLGGMVEYYQPLDVRQRTFLETIAAVSRDGVSIFQDDHKLADYRVEKGQGSLAGGLNLGLLGQARAGWKETLVEYRLETGTPNPYFQTDQQQFGSWFVDLHLDQMNRLYFPTKGWGLDANYAGTPEEDYQRFSAIARGAVSLYDMVVATRLAYTDSPQGSLPYYDAANLGGFLNLSGFARGQLIGDEVAYGQLRVEKIIGRLPLGLRGDMRAGLALEAGRIGQPYTETNETGWLDSTAVYLGGETPLGPVYLGYGYSSIGSHNVYLFIGTP